MDGWMGGWMDGWMGGWMDGWVGRNTYRHTQQNRKNGPSLWDTLAHRQDHIQKDWN
jgi:hypothetical protein